LAERTPGACSAGRSRFLGDEIMTILPVTKLDRFLPLAQAARRLGLSEGTLRQLVNSGKVRAAVLPSGEIGVSEQSAKRAASYEQINEQLRAVHRRDFANLRGKSITIADAAEKYDILDRTLREWVKRGLVTVVEDGYGKRLDEAGVAYCAKVYHVRRTGKSLSGAPLLDEDGNPNLLKNPQLSEYRRRKNGLAQ
jgi:transposase-like protein